jgi:hypothetical protein
METILDPAVLTVLRGYIGDAALAAVVARFNAGVGARIARLGGLSAEKLKFELHSIRGAAAEVGAVAICKAAGALEHEAAALDTVETAERVRQLQELFEATWQLLALQSRT